jgi:hypothetical protein
MASYFHLRSTSRSTSVLPTLFAAAFLSLLLLAGCGGSDSGADHVKEQSRGTTNSPDEHVTGASTDPGIPGTDMTNRPFGFGEGSSEPYTEGGNSQIRMEKIDVTLNDGGIVLPKSVRAGTVTLNVVNSGTGSRTFRIETPNRNVEPTGDLEPGKGITLTAGLQPGTYNVYSSGEVNGEKKELTGVLRVTE